MTIVDELWHATILDTRLYAKLKDALGVVLHHRPSGASDEESELREKRLNAMKGIYTAFFSTDPLGTSLPQPRVALPPKAAEATVILAGHISISVRTNDRDIFFKAKSQTPVSTLMKGIEHVTGIPANSGRLYFEGNRIDDRMSLEFHGVEDGDMLEFHLAQDGC